MPTTTVPPLYLKLIHQFPLRPLRCDAELERAIAVSLSLDTRGSGSLAPEERDYHNVLVGLISQYEEENHPIPDVSGPELLRCLIENRGLTQSAVAHGSGISESALSEILASRRPMGRKTIETLAGYFHVDPGLFLARGDRVARSKGSEIAPRSREVAVSPKAMVHSPIGSDRPTLRKAASRAKPPAEAKATPKPAAKGKRKGAKS